MSLVYAEVYLSISRSFYTVSYTHLDVYKRQPLLYQLSYRGKMATRTRLELVTSAVTGRHSNQLNHRAVLSSMISIGSVSYTHLDVYKRQL